MSNFDRLKKTKPRINIEKSIKQILNIIKEPHKVYGHGVGSLNEIEKINARLDTIESTLLDIKDHLGLLSNTDKLNMLTNDKELKKDQFTGKLQEANWYVYMLECNDKSIYTGICKNDIQRRMKEHQSGKGSKYVRSRLPFKLVWSKGGFTASEALKEEYRIKQLDKEDKRTIWQTKK
jgi:putative endonuclease